MQLDRIKPLKLQYHYSHTREPFPTSLNWALWRRVFCASVNYAEIENVSNLKRSSQIYQNNNEKMGCWHSHTHNHCTHTQTYSTFAVVPSDAPESEGLYLRRRFAGHLVWTCSKSISSVQPVSVSCSVAPGTKYLFLFFFLISPSIAPNYYCFSKGQTL